MIAAFEGWNDAGDAATSAIEHLALTWDAEELTEVDPESFYDFQVSRPEAKLVDGVTRRIEWPTTRLTFCRMPAPSARHRAGARHRTELPVEGVLHASSSRSRSRSR